jgi:hypothetical protein
VIAEQLEKRGVGGDVEGPVGTVERQLDAHNRLSTEEVEPAGMMQAHPTYAPRVTPFPGGSR